VRYNAEIFDQVQSLFKVTKFNDHQLHCVINFDNKVNKDVMKRSIFLMLDVVPILGSIYVTDKGHPYWERVDISRYTDVIISTDNEVEFNSFITSKTNEFTGPQMKACLLTSGKDSLAIIMNHMVCDASDFKEYLYLLSDLYSKIVKNFDYSPDYIVNGDRSLKRINSQFKLKDKIMAFAFQNKENNKNSSYKFPMSGEKETNPFILIHKLHKDRYLIIKEYYKRYNITLNDVVLAAYYRVLYNMLDIDSKSDLNIPIMVDMRRNLKDKTVDALCNLSSTAITHIDHNINDEFYDTVVKVNKDMNLKKSKFIGLNGLIKLSIIFRIFNYKISNSLVERALKNPLICMTNIGILDFEKLQFEGVSIDEAYECGSIKYKPHFQLALSSFNDSITFSVNLYGSSEDKEIIEHFFNLLDEELPQ